MQEIVNTILVILAVMVLVGWIIEKIDRKNNPKKWARIDEENAAKKFWDEYKRTTGRIPKSQWMLMNREEKSNIFYKREQLKVKFYKLPSSTQKLIKLKYGVDTKLFDSY